MAGMATALNPLEGQRTHSTCGCAEMSDWDEISRRWRKVLPPENVCPRKLLKDAVQDLSRNNGFMFTFGRLCRPLADNKKRTCCNRETRKTCENFCSKRLGGLISGLGKSNRLGRCTCLRSSWRVRCGESWRRQTSGLLGQSQRN